MQQCKSCGAPRVVAGHYLCGPCLTGDASTAGRESELVLQPAAPELRRCCGTPKGSGPHAAGCPQGKATGSPS